MKSQDVALLAQALCLKSQDVALLAQALCLKSHDVALLAQALCLKSQDVALHAQTPYVTAPWCSQRRFTLGAYLWAGVVPECAKKTLVPLSSPIDESPEAVREALAPLRNDFSVAVDSCGNAFAVGAIIRVAHSFLVREILIVGEAPYYEKASMGMEKYETILRLPDADALLEHARGRPLWAVEKEGSRRSLHASFDFPKGVIFVFGSERTGVSAKLLERADEVLGIPMYGVNNSFPVAVAAGMVMAEWARRRYSGRVAL